MRGGCNARALELQRRREVERMVQRAQAERERAAEAALAAGVAETIALEEGRGERFTPPQRARAPGPRRRKDGLDWLHDKGRITQRQKTAGERYGADWRRAQPPSTRSCLDETVRGSGELTPSEARAHAAVRVQRVRAAALNGNATLVEAADKVCGEGLSPAQWAEGDDRLTGRLEERIQRTLELLEAYYFG